MAPCSRQLSAIFSERNIASVNDSIRVDYCALRILYVVFTIRVHLPIVDAIALGKARRDPVALVASDDSAKVVFGLVSPYPVFGRFPVTDLR